MKSHTETLKQLRAYASINALADALSRCVHDLDASERAAKRDTQAVYLARNVLLLAKAKRSTKGAAKIAEAGGDDAVRARFCVAEIDRLQVEVDAKINKLVMAGGGAGIGEYGLLAWARRRVKAAKPTASRAGRTAPKKAVKPKGTGNRRTTKASPPPRIKRGIRAVKSYSLQPDGSTIEDVVDTMNGLQAVGNSLRR